MTKVLVYPGIIVFKKIPNFIILPDSEIKVDCCRGLWGYSSFFRFLKWFRGANIGGAPITFPLCLVCSLVNTPNGFDRLLESNMEYFILTNVDQNPSTKVAGFSKKFALQIMRDFWHFYHDKLCDFCHLSTQDMQINWIQDSVETHPKAITGLYSPCTLWNIDNFTSSFIENFKSLLMINLHYNIHNA